MKDDIQCCDDCARKYHPIDCLGDCTDDKCSRFVSSGDTDK